MTSLLFSPLTFVAWLLLALALGAAAPIAGAGTALLLLGAAGLVGIALPMLPARPQVVRPLGLVLFLGLDGGALALGATGASLLAPSLGDLALPLLHAVAVVAFVETAHAAARAAQLPDGRRLLTAPFLKQATLTLPLLAGLLALTAASPLLLAWLLPATVGDSYEVGAPFGVALGAIAVGLIALTLAALAHRAGRESAAPPTSSLEDSA